MKNINILYACLAFTCAGLALWHPTIKAIGKQIKENKLQEKNYNDLLSSPHFYTNKNTLYNKLYTLAILLEDTALKRTKTIFHNAPKITQLVTTYRKDNKKNFSDPKFSSSERDQLEKALIYATAEFEKSQFEDDTRIMGQNPLAASTILDFLYKELEVLDERYKPIIKALRDIGQSINKKVSFANSLMEHTVIKKLPDTVKTISTQELQTPIVQPNTTLIDDDVKALEKFEKQYGALKEKHGQLPTKPSAQPEQSSSVDDDLKELEELGKKLDALKR